MKTRIGPEKSQLLKTRYGSKVKESKKKDQPPDDWKKDINEKDNS